MKTFFAVALLFALAITQPVCADTSLVFNEVMYHPATNEPAMEWLELHNQMAVDVDISDWSLDGGISYKFGSNVVVKGGGFLVVAVSPTNLTAATGATNVFGPFTNRLSNSGQQLLLRNNNGRVVSEVNYGTEGDWPVAPDGSGVSLAKLDRTTASKPSANWTVSAQMGGTPGTENFPSTPPPAPLAFNEHPTPATNAFWLELVNHGTNSLPLAGFVVARDGPTNDNEYAFPSGTLAAGGFLAISNTTLGFLPVAGDRLYLLPPGRTNVLDALVVKSTARGRSPAGTGAWLRPTTPTAGASNVIVLRDEIVINEIMYHQHLLPGTSNLPPQPSDEEWIELFNQSTNSVDLTGWKLDGGISYDFPAGETLAPGAYLIVARNVAALSGLYPTADIVGNFSGRLSHKGDSVVLKDAAGNPADSVRYFNAGRWPANADGGGSSLELRDPKADNARPEAWAASDESAKSAWQTYTYFAVAQTMVGSNYWDDFLLGVLNGGECLIDDISVIESPTNSPVEFIVNGDFENGLDGWRVLGNHRHSRVETDPDAPGNNVLHLIASGPQEDLHNHIEATLANGNIVTDGELYQISFRAKWLGGNNLLNTRLYYDRAARTTPLPTPSLTGTPGAQNSRSTPNLGPTFSQFAHRAVVPAADQAVTVTVMAQDPQGVGSCEVHWSEDGGSFSSAPMTAQGGGLYQGTIPGLAAGTIVQFYVRAVDGLGAASTYPAAGADGGALYVVADGQADLNLGHNLRVLFTPDTWALLRAETNLMSNEVLPCTVIYDEQRAYYDMGLRLKGSQSGRVIDPRPSFHLYFQPDDLFRGVHPVMAVDASGPPGAVNAQEEIVFQHLALHAGGIPEVQPDLCRVILPLETNTGPALLVPKFEDEFIESAYANGGDGQLWLMELDYYPTTADAEGYKLPSPQEIWGTDLIDLGDDKETYRYNFMLKNHRNVDDYSPLINLAKVLSLPNGPLLATQTKHVMDLDEWLRVFALISLCGEADWYTFGNPHNLLMYLRPSDHKVLAFPLDVEHVLRRPADAPLVGEPSYWTDVQNLPGNTRRLYAHALDIIGSTFNTDYMSYWVNHYASFAPGQDYSDFLSYITLRTAAVTDEINAAGGDEPFTVAGPASVTTSENLVTFTGTAPVQVQSIRINGIEYPVTWSSVSDWTLLVPVTSPTNVLNLVGYDLHGNPLTNFAATISVDYTGPALNPVGAVVINEIHHNAAEPDASFLELHNTSATASFDLSNWRVNGLGYTFPPGSVITNDQCLVLIKDHGAFTRSHGTGICPLDVFPGNLQTNGETLTLLMPGALTNQEVVVDKVRYSNAAPWPATAPGASLQLIDPLQDHSRVANWAAAQSTPCAGNTVSATLPEFPPLWLNELQADNLTGITNSAGQRKPWLELYNAGTNVVALTNLFLTKTYTNLTAWPFPADAVIAPGQFKVIFCDGLTNLSTPNELHTSFSLPGGAGSLALSWLQAGESNVLDYLDYTNVVPNRSYGSLPDGQCFDRLEFFYVTPGGANNSASAPLTVVINELMAANTHTLVNPVNGKYSDWFELYNYSTNTAYLGGFYLTDSLTNKFKFQIPAGYTIPPRGFLLVWADEKNTNGTPDLHVNFKMSKAGESLGLYGADGNPVDFINYGAQADDISQGRFLDGALDQFFMPTPTPRTNNIIPNTAPSVAAISGKFVHAGQTLRFTAAATDAESAYQSLTFSLDPGAVAGAGINPLTGVFTWTASNVPVPSTNVITVRVTDDGTPPLSGTATFSVTVLPRPQMSCAKPSANVLSLTFATLPGQTYQIQYKNNLDDPMWMPLSSPVPGNGGVLQANDDTSAHPQRFYRLLVLP